MKTVQTCVNGCGCKRIVRGAASQTYDHEKDKVDKAEVEARKIDEFRRAVEAEVKVRLARRRFWTRLKDLFRR